METITLAIFVWTFDGVIKAIGLGFALVILLIVGLFIAWEKLKDWWKK